MRAAIYVRLSRETDETTSPERQRAACEALCEARGWEVVAAEEDIDVSGFSRGLDRPGLQRILTRLAQLDVIVFFKIDRLARSTVDFAEIMRLAEHQSVALASATEPLDLTSSMGRAMAKVIAVFAELESDTIGMRVSSAHEHLRREGRYTGGRVPYGYMVVPSPNGAGKVLAVNEDEAKTIRKIVEQVLAKDSLMQIINDLNKEGVPSPGHTSRQTTGKRSDSKQWYTTTLRSVSESLGFPGWGRVFGPVGKRSRSPVPLSCRPGSGGGGGVGVQVEACAEVGPAWPVRPWGWAHRVRCLPPRTPPAAARG
jgi:site-specific DNA recombinase